MASTKSRGRPFWVGAGVGAAFSISLALALSLITPLEQDAPGAPANATTDEAADQNSADLTSAGLSDEDQPSGAGFAERGDGEGSASAGDGGTDPSPTASTPLDEVASEAPEAPETAPAPDVIAANGASEDDRAATPEAASPEAPEAPAEPSSEAPAVENAPLSDEPEPVEVAAAPATLDPAPDPAPVPASAQSDAVGEAPSPASGDGGTTDGGTSDGVEVAIAEPAAEPAPQPAAPPAVPSASLSDFQIDGLPPFQAYSEEFEGDASEPFLSIVLLGVGEGPEDLDELLLLPGPLTVVLTPDTEGLEDVTLDLRDAGFEVLLGLNADAVSGGATGPAETAAARMDAIDEAMGVAAIGAAMDEPDVADAVVLAAQSRGFSLLDASSPGGGAGYRLAKSRDLPAAPNGRRFDEIRTSAMVFQALERAAFDARRTGVFVVTGETTKDVITGVRRWMNVKANKTINVAPLSVAIDKFGDQ